MVIETEICSKLMPSNSHQHVIDGIHRHAQPADFAIRLGVVAVESHQRRQIECGAETSLTFFQQQVEIARWSVPGCRNPANCRIVQ